MAIYAIGDIQGCFESLQRLLDKINFDQATDQIWFCGDLVNRGPDSLKTVRFIKSLGKSSVSVLGNHDLHLLAVSMNSRKIKSKDSFYDILNAEDRNELLKWIRHRPLMYRNNKFCLLHAGLPPQWDIDLAEQCAREAENTIRGEQFFEFLTVMYSDYPDQWSDKLTGWERTRFIINCFTRMRYCNKQGKLDLKHKGRPGSQPGNLLPWFEIPIRKSRSTTIIFGHWSTLGFYAENNCFCIDTGCLWGGQLTALRLDNEMDITSVDCNN